MLKRKNISGFSISTKNYVLEVVTVHRIPRTIALCRKFGGQHKNIFRIGENKPC